MKPVPHPVHNMSDEVSPSRSGQAEKPPERRLVLRLYITRGATNSVCALANLRDICQRHYNDRYDLEIIDILRDPRRAFTDGIMLTPTLVKLSPSPQARIVGDLSQTERVLQVLGVLDQG
jgi:circadian clock protein KaiB